MDSSDANIRKRNGQVIMEALKNLSLPASLVDVVNYVAATHHLSQNEIKDLVKAVLEEGVQHGFIQKSGTKYSAEFDFAESEVDDELEEKSRRRSGRKGRSRSRKRGRSRSRSRRRRR